MEEIPTLRMISLDEKKLKKRGRRLLRRLSKETQAKAQFILREDTSEVGGGALPLQELPTFVIAIKPIYLSVNGLEERLRRGEPPVIARISKDELILDLRTVFDEEVPLLSLCIEKAFA